MSTYKDYNNRINKEMTDNQPNSARQGLLVACLAGSVLLLALLDIALGSVRIPLLEVLKSLSSKASRPEWTTIVLVFRMPNCNPFFEILWQRRILLVLELAHLLEWRY